MLTASSDGIWRLHRADAARVHPLSFWESALACLPGSALFAPVLVSSGTPKLTSRSASEVFTLTGSCYGTSVPCGREPTSGAGHASIDATSGGSAWRSCSFMGERHLCDGCGWLTTTMRTDSTRTTFENTRKPTTAKPVMQLKKKALTTRYATWDWSFKYRMSS